MKFVSLFLCLSTSLSLLANERSEIALHCQGKPKTAQAIAPFHPGQDGLAECVRPSYDYPAAVNLQDGCGLFATGSYLYWLAGEEGLILAKTSTYFPELNFFDIGTPTPDHVITQDAQYSSGYKLGLGYILNKYDGWTFRADYTSLHSAVNQTVTAAPSTTPDAINILSMNWFFQGGHFGQTLVVPTLYSSWHMNLDMVDGVATRPCYQGNRMIIAPFGGLRAAFIRQNLHVSIESILNVTNPIRTSSVSHNQSHSWGLGPRGGLEARWLLGYGLRLQGEIGASLLFTHYSKVTHSEDVVSQGLDTPIVFSLHNYNCLRPMLETNLGLGWLYYCKEAVAIDLIATYDFNYLWGQNMMRLLDTFQPASDLFLHGLTVSLGVTF